jgi:Type II secretion system (T2SS), protein M
MSTMTTRDRLVLLGMIAAVLLAAMWFLVVSPVQKEAASLSTQISQARVTLDAAQGKLDVAQGARAQYTTAYASLVRLGAAIPEADEVPSLLYQIDQLSNAKKVRFNSITSSANGSGPGASPPASAAAAAASGGFTQLPFTFTFAGSFFDLYNLLNRIQQLAVQVPDGNVRVTGRLLTVQSANLTANEQSTNVSAGSNGSQKAEELTGTITATAYVLPSGQSLTGGATPAGPAGSSQQVSAPSGGSSTPAAVARVTP